MPVVMTPFTILLHAHDALWRMREFSLADRHEGCKLIWRAVCAEGVK